MEAVQMRSIPLVRMLLTLPGIDVNQECKGSGTSLGHAIKNGQTEVVKLLWEGGAEHIVLGVKSHYPVNGSRMGDQAFSGAEIEQRLRAKRR
jgi:ankyrin repeat protein